MATTDPEMLRAWARGWQETGKQLEAIRRAELRALTPAQGLRATENVLSLAGSLPRSTVRRGSSGLVEQQRLFARLRP